MLYSILLLCVTTSSLYTIDLPGSNLLFPRKTRCCTCSIESNIFVYSSGTKKERRNWVLLGWLLPETITKSITFQNFNPKIKSSTKYTYNTYTNIIIINYNTYSIGYYYSNKFTLNIIVILVTKDILKTLILY
jgi:hypothetical protein